MIALNSMRRKAASAGFMTDEENAASTIPSMRLPFNFQERKVAARYFPAAKISLLITKKGTERIQDTGTGGPACYRIVNLFIIYSQEKKRNLPDTRRIIIYRAGTQIAFIFLRVQGQFPFVQMKAEGHRIRRILLIYSAFLIEIL